MPPCQFTVSGRRRFGIDEKKRRLWFFKAAAEIKERQATVLILLQYGYWGHKLNQKRADNSSISNCILSALRLCVWLF